MKKIIYSIILSFFLSSVAYTENKGTPNTGLPINEDGSIPDNYDTDTFGGAKNADVDVTDTDL